MIIKEDDLWGEHQPLDIKHTADAIAARLDQMGLIPRALEGKIRDIIFDHIQFLDVLRTEQIAHLKRELLEYINRSPCPIILRKDGSINPV